MDRLSSFVLAHRRWVFAFWALMFVAGIAAAGKVPDRLSYDFSLPGQQGYETEQKIIASYQGANAQAAYVPVVTVPQGQTIMGSASDVQAVYDALRQIPTLRVVDYSQTHDKGFITSDGRTTFGIVYEPQPQGFLDPNQKLIEDTFNAQLKQHDLSGGLTGYEQLSSGGGDNGGPSVLEETLLGALGALAVLAFVFIEPIGSWIPTAPSQRVWTSRAACCSRGDAFTHAPLAGSTPSNSTPLPPPRYAAVRRVTCSGSVAPTTRSKEPQPAHGAQPATSSPADPPWIGARTCQAIRRDRSA